MIVLANEHLHGTNTRTPRALIVTLQENEGAVVAQVHEGAWNTINQQLKGGFEGQSTNAKFSRSLDERSSLCLLFMCAAGGGRVRRGAAVFSSAIIARK